MRTTRFICYKNAGYAAFLHFVSEKFAMTVSLKDCTLLEKLFYKNDDCVSVAAEVPDTEGIEKRRWSDDCTGSVKNDSEIRKDRLFLCATW